MKVTAANAEKIKVLHEYESDSENDFRNTPEYDRFCEQVYKVTKKPMCTRDYREALGDDYKDNWILNAIESLIGKGRLYRLWGAHSRWDRSSRERAVKKVRFNGSDRLDKSDKVLPYSGIKNESPTYSYNK